MSKLTKKFRLMLAAGLALTCPSLTVQAVLKRLGEQPSLRRTLRQPPELPTPTPTPTPMRKERLGNILRNPNVTVAPGIFGRIRWKQEYGFPSTDGGATPNKSLNCTAFRVQATVQQSGPGPFGKTEGVGYFSTQNEPSEESGYYVCSYSLADRNLDFPHDRVITVSAFLGPFASDELNRALTQGAWFGEGQPQPPPGYQRVMVGGRGVTLTDSAPRATVDFEMEYRPIPTSPR